MKPVTADAISSIDPTLRRWSLNARTVNLSLPGTVDDEDRIAAKCFLQEGRKMINVPYLCLCLCVFECVCLSVLINVREC